MPAKYPVAKDANSRYVRCPDCGRYIPRDKLQRNYTMEACLDALARQEAEELARHA